MAVIGLSGKIKSGKDTTAEIYRQILWMDKIGQNIDRYDAASYEAMKDVTAYQFQLQTMSGVEVVKFADSIKDTLVLWLGCTREDLESQEFKARTLPEEWWFYKIAGKIYARFSFPTEEDNKMAEERYLVKPTVRYLLQTLGTEAGRMMIHPNIWVNIAFSKYKPRPKQAWLPLENPLDGYVGKCVKCGASWHSKNKHNQYCKKCNQEQPDIYPNWIFTDARFINEIDRIKHHEGKVFRVFRPFENGTEVDLRVPIYVGGNPNFKGIVRRYIPEEREYHIDINGGIHTRKRIEVHINGEHESETALDFYDGFDDVIENHGDLDHLINEIKTKMF